MMMKFRKIVIERKDFVLNTWCVIIINIKLI